MNSIIIDRRPLRASDYRAAVPCDGCTACCHFDLVVLHPAEGDDPSQYQTVKAVHPLSGKPILALARQANGDCIYLGPQGCTIHDRAPLICREFDCRRWYRSKTRVERRRMVARGHFTDAVFAAGRARVGTLPA